MARSPYLSIVLLVSVFLTPSREASSEEGAEAQAVDVPKAITTGLVPQLEPARPNCDPSDSIRHASVVGGDGPPPTAGSLGVLPLTFDLQSPLKDYECTAWFASANAYQPATLYEGNTQIEEGKTVSRSYTYDARGANRELQLGCKKKASKNTFFDFRVSINQLGKPNCWIDHFACGEFIEAFHKTIGYPDPFGRVATGSVNAASLEYCQWKAIDFQDPTQSCKSRTGDQVYFGTLSAGFAGLWNLVDSNRVRVSAGGSLTLGVGNTFLQGMTPEAGATAGVIASVALDKKKDFVLSLRATAGVVVAPGEAFGIKDGNATYMGSAEVGLRMNWNQNWSTTLSAGYFEKSVPTLAYDRRATSGMLTGASVDSSYWSTKNTFHGMEGRREGNITGAIETCWSPCSCVAGRVWEGLDPIPFNLTGKGLESSFNGSNNEMDFGTSLSFKTCFGD